MKWHNLAKDPGIRMYATPRQREVLDVFNECKSSPQAAQILDINTRSIDRMMTGLVAHAATKGYVPQVALTKSQTRKDATESAVDAKVVKKNVAAIRKEIRIKGRHATFVITWAQNATPVHEGFLAALKHYCTANEAKLIVIPGRYKNPTSQWSQHQEDNEYWVPEVSAYLMNHRVPLNENISIMGDIKIQPTAERPLSGFSTITGHSSGIFGHPKLQLSSIATPQNRLPKLITTTGAVTVQNYTDTKAGKKGEFHHTLGAVVVEIVNKKEFHIRQINALEDGSFIDLTREYTASGVQDAPPPLALVMGDIHTDVMCPMCEQVTFFDKDGIVPYLRPERIILHDWYDGYSGSHHHDKKVFIKYAKHKSGRDDVKAELDRTFARTKKWVESCDAMFYVVGSNHNEHLTQWLERNEPKNDPRNAEFYHYLMYRMYQEINMGTYGAHIPNPLEILCRDDATFRDRLSFVDRDDSLQIADIECGMHGDVGTNGSRGSVVRFNTIGVKSITGHTHSPAIEGGAYQVGTNSALKLEYTVGPSSWLNTDCLIYANGKRTLINKIDGKWRA